MLRVGSFAAPLAALSLALAVAMGGCTPEPAKVVSVWPAASTEATVAPDARRLRAPLTGEPLAETAVATVPVCVKLRQTSPANPSGVAEADVVYETADTAGNGTWLACLYSRDLPARVGPVAAAGMPDLWIVPQYRAMLFSQGATSTLATSLGRWPKGSDASVTRGVPFSSAYERRKGGAFVRGPVAEGLARRLASDVTSAGPARLRFSESVPESATAIGSVAIPFAPRMQVSWKWDAKSSRYVRTVAGKSATNTRGGSGVSASNVVVMWVRYTAVDQDLAGEGGYDVTLGGSGQASVFRNGVRIDGRWSADGDSPPRFVGRDGSSIRLAPGSTWIEAIPLSTNITLR